ncbi:hypothetical protein ACTHR6_08215 [Ralstonia holmesii]|uniref:Uncharacterized protein n=1 Tax=Ralstonia holmesii TaxID=3058602 RepID=A0ABC8QCZ4_9RALS|nr:MULTISPECIES: hypothetical protein [Ralstonia]CAJ0776040.1 hypothetical protein LMG18096_00492 [Ralstonia sp. LMG 32967]CAJ0814072.1 hypothetical protein LMG18093_02220 [Ralstonia sp. LMG 32967]
MQGLSARFEKTDAGRREIATRNGALSRTSRALLIMVDGHVTGEDLAVRAGQLGLEAQAVFELMQAGFIQSATDVAGDAVFVQVAEPQPEAPEAPKAGASAAPARKRSLAAARMYLMDIAARTFSSAEHPIRQRLVEATDRASVESAFDALLAALREATSASMVEQVEVSFRGFLPAEEGAAG